MLMALAARLNLLKFGVYLYIFLYQFLSPLTKVYDLIHRGSKEMQFSKQDDLPERVTGEKWNDLIHFGPDFL